ncbi:MAG: hypothetical protein ABSA79_10495 [Candidatus Bathyarchaeia archaeon]|jgi:hypothetical protein
METKLNVHEYLENNRVYFESATSTEKGITAKLVPNLIRTNPTALLRLLNEMDRYFHANWMGTLANSVFIPSKNEAPKQEKGREDEELEYCIVNVLFPITVQVYGDKAKRDMEKRVLSQFNTVNDSQTVMVERKEEPLTPAETQAGGPAVPSVVEPQLAADPQLEKASSQEETQVQEAPAQTETPKQELTLEPTEAEEIQQCFERVRTYFVVQKTSPMKIANDIQFLLKHGFNRTQIAEKVAASKPSIGKYAALNLELQTEAEKTPVP